MKNLEIIQRIKKMDKLITMKSTGTPKEFAKKMNLSESRLYAVLVELKELGVPIKYNRRHRTYNYLDDGEFTINVEWKYKKNNFFDERSFTPEK